MLYVSVAFRLVCKLFLFCASIFSKSCELLSLQTVFENTLMQHHIALPPDAMGKITYIAPPGQYSITVSSFLFFLTPLL